MNCFLLRIAKYYIYVMAFGKKKDTDATRKDLSLSAMAIRSTSTFSKVKSPGMGLSLHPMPSSSSHMDKSARSIGLKELGTVPTDRLLGNEYLRCISSLFYGKPLSIFFRSANVCDESNNMCCFGRGGRKKCTRCCLAHNPVCCCPHPKIIDLAKVYDSDDSMASISMEQSLELAHICSFPRAIYTVKGHSITCTLVCDYFKRSPSKLNIDNPGDGNKSYFIDKKGDKDGCHTSVILTVRDETKSIKSGGIPIVSLMKDCGRLYFKGSDDAIVAVLTYNKPHDSACCGVPQGRVQVIFSRCSTQIKAIIIGIMPWIVDGITGLEGDSVKDKYTSTIVK
ncbi:hypothetical protein ADUPG1_006410 [Aduncisulcus paluster]|uniref:Uncharacterized protein n=1 Tax=Aduncisulcus paluster TaxID=2918883 RepID=A0ABQ5KJX3_9EUKA|nr:hypothetical protein ADUPG1_006410 [Aduncisulcus paluster]